MERKKVLGICLAKMQDRVRTEYLNAINRAAAIEGWKTVAYNSFRDFRKNDRSLQGAKSIYKIINYDEIDVIAVFPESINNSEVSDALIESARAAGKPVICVGPEKQGCYSVVRDYEAAFSEMLEHLICDHGIKDFYFVSGFKYDDQRSAGRLDILKRVLKKNGIDFDESGMYYGDYKEEVIDIGIDKLLSGNHIPQAIICIDDKTAITVCDKLHEYDLKAPDDIVVTGFGGIPAAYYYHPSITSCSDDVEEFAKMVIQAAKDAVAEKKPDTYRDVFKARIRRSCGCDMRSYMSAGRRAYDLEAARAAGIHVPDGVISAEKKENQTASGTGDIQKETDETKNTGDTDNKEQSIPANDAKDKDILNEDTVFEPNAAAEGTVVLYKKKNEEPDEDLTENKDNSDKTASDYAENKNDSDKTAATGAENSLSEKNDEPICDQKALSEFAASNPRLADMKVGAYDVTYGAGRVVDEGKPDEDMHGNIPKVTAADTGGSNAGTSDTNGPHMAKIYSSDIFRHAGVDKENIHISPWLGSPNNSAKPENSARSETSSDKNTSSLGNETTDINYATAFAKAIDAANDIKISTDPDKAAKRAMEVADDKRCAGGHSEEKFRSNNHVAYIYKELDEIERREDSFIAWIDRMLELTEVADICDEISKRIPSGSILYMYTELLETNFDIETFENDHLKGDRTDAGDAAGSDGEAFKKLSLTRIISAQDVIPNAKNPKGSTIDEICVKDIASSYIEAESDGCMLVLSPVFIGDFVCGYYAVKTGILSEIRSKTKLLNFGLNMIFRFLANQNRQQRMLYSIENSVYVSSMTGLPNLKGSTRWFEGFAENEENHKRKISISVFAMPRYTYIYENYGLYEIEEAVRLVVEKLRSSCQKTSFLGQFAEGEYVVIDFESEQGNYGEAIFRDFSKEMDEYNRGSTKEYYLEVNFGTATVEEGWDSTLENLVRMAMSDMYLRRLRQGKAAPVIRDKTFDREYFTTFELLVDRNLFRYHFQPIVDASTGNICAYEALMRTGGGISMTPLDILEIAKNANRLYDIEKATIFNVLKFYSENIDKFGDRKIFINTLPGYFLNDEDRNEAVEKYGKYLDSVVFEVTESDTVTDDELEKLRRPAPGGQQPSVAVDDYGTGHSNIVNLLRYAPQIIKIDHYLISNIQDDSNKQMFVKNTIEFAAMNNMKVLAEGVETYEELKKVIEYGVDYVQGYYTAHPDAEIMQQIPNNIRNEILSESIKAASFDSDNLVYNAKAGETVNLLDIALKKYTVVNVLGGKVRLVGEPDNVIDMIVKVADNKKTELTFENVNLRGTLETTVQLGKNTETALYILGECTLNKDGIYVPAGSRLTVSGDGNLHIITSRNLSVGIGSNCNEPHGDISFDMTGSVKIVANGDKAVGIGGGRCEGSRIRLLNGNFDISAKAIHAVAIGSDIGDTDIYIGRTAKCKLKSDGNDSVGLGSISGNSEILCRGRLEITGDGEKTVGIGSLNGTTMTNLLNNDFTVALHSYCGIGIGSLMGTGEIKLEDAKTEIYAEGTQINGIGGGEDKVGINVYGGDLKVEILAGIPRSFGAQKGKTILHYGSITCLHDTDVTVLDEHRERMKPRRIENGIVFEV